MIYLVLREPTATGYVNRFAYTDDPATTSVMCGGQSIAVTKGRITSIGEMGNRADISQAKGAVAQGVEGSFAIADWDGTERTSAGIYAGQNRFYGWSVAIARHDTSTTPVWFNSEDHWCVTDLQIDGTSISVSVGERWALDGRLLAFGDNGAQVPLVVGGHDVWVQPAKLSDPTPIDYTVTYGWMTGNPTNGAAVGTVERYAGSKQMMLAINQQTGAQESVPAFLFKAQLTADATAFLYATKFPPVGSLPVILQGNSNSFRWVYGTSTTHFQTSFTDNTGVYSYAWIQVPQDFYDNESPENVCFCQGSVTTPVASGASDLIGYQGAVRPIKPAGEVAVSAGVMSFTPADLTSTGFLAMTNLDSFCRWVLGSNSGTLDAAPNVLYYNGVQSISTSDAPPAFVEVDATAHPQSPLAFAVWGDFESAGDTHKLQFLIDASALDPSEDYAKVLVTATIRADAKITQSLADDTAIAFPFGAGSHTFRFGEESSLLVSKNLLGAKRYASIDAVNADGFFQMEGEAGQASVQINELSLWGETRFENGSSYALVKTGPSSLGSLTALDPYNVARAIIAYPMDSPDSIALNAAIPSYVPAAADFGECMDATKSYTVNGETIAQEAWLVFGQYVGGFVAAGEPNTSGQGIGEVPTAVALVLGRFEDIVTEPVIEYCNVAGTLTKKAYIANVDLEYDSTNPSKFFGGWGIGYDTPLDTIIDATGTWYRQGTGPYPSVISEPTDGTGDWYYDVPTFSEKWYPAPSHDYGYLIWKQCRAAYKVHRVNRGKTYQFNGIYTDSVIGRMWWEAKRNGSRRIEWLCLQPRYLTYSVREDRPLNWAGSSVYIAGSMANYAGYDVSTWDNAGGDQLVVVEKRYNLQTAIATYTVAIPPLATVDTVPIYRDTINAALDKLVDTVDATAVTPKYIDTLEP